MYSVRWYNRNGTNIVVGNWDSIISVANFLENNKTFFKIANVSGTQINQNDTECGGFQYWLKPEDIFPEQH